MKVAIIGASGCIGTALTHHLATTTDHELVLFSHYAEDLTYSPYEEKNLIHTNGDILKYDDINDALDGCDIAVYLVHLMGSSHVNGSFMDNEKIAAKNFANAVINNRVQKVIYAGGMGNSGTDLTAHLSSRDTTGKYFFKRLENVIELNIPMVIGPKAAGFEVIRLLSHLPILPIPTWANGVTYPIGLNDVVMYIHAAITYASTGNVSVAVGGPERLTYRQVILRYSRYKHRKTVTFPLPFVSKRIVKWVLNRFERQKYIRTVADMIESAGYSTDADQSQALEIFPHVKPDIINKSFF